MEKDILKIDECVTMLRVGKLMVSVMNRIMVGLPSVESREMILKTLLAKEKAEDLDFKELATMTEGYSGSDLKVCTSTDINGELIKNLLLCWLLGLIIETEFVHDSSLSSCKGATTTREIEGG